MEPEDKQQGKVKKMLKFGAQSFAPALTSQQEQYLLDKFKERKWPHTLQTLFSKYYAKNFLNNVQNEEIKIMTMTIGNFSSAKYALIHPSEDKIIESGKENISTDPKASHSMKIESCIRSSFQKGKFTFLPRFIVKESFSFCEIDCIFDTIEECGSTVDFRRKFPAQSSEFEPIKFHKNERIYMEMKNSLIPPGEGSAKDSIFKTILDFRKTLETFQPIFCQVPQYFNKFRERYMLIYNFSDDKKLADLINECISDMETDNTKHWFTKNFEAYWYNHYDIKEATITRLVRFEM